jgi:hypothetical protein
MRRGMRPLFASEGSRLSAAPILTRRGIGPECDLNQAHFFLSGSPSNQIGSDRGQISARSSAVGASNEAGAADDTSHFRTAFFSEHFASSGEMRGIDRGNLACGTGQYANRRKRGCNDGLIAL